MAEPSGPARRRGQPRLLAWMLAFTACALALNALIGERSLAESRRRQQQLARTASRLEQLRAENDGLRVRVQRLRRDPQTIEAIARAELGLIRRGEVLFLIKDVGAGRPAPLTAAPHAR